MQIAIIRRHQIFRRLSAGRLTLTREHRLVHAPLSGADIAQLAMCFPKEAIDAIANAKPAMTGYLDFVEFVECDGILPCVLRAPSDDVDQLLLSPAFEALVSVKFNVLLPLLVLEGVLLTGLFASYAWWTVETHWAAGDDDSAEAGVHAGRVIAMVLALVFSAAEGLQLHAAMCPLFDYNDDGTIRENGSKLAGAKRYLDVSEPSNAIDIAALAMTLVTLLGWGEAAAAAATLLLLTVKLIYSVRSSQNFGSMIQLLTATAWKWMFPFACLLGVFLLAFTLIFAILEGSGEDEGDGDGFPGLVSSVYELAVMGAYDSMSDWDSTTFILLTIVINIVRYHMQQLFVRTCSARNLISYSRVLCDFIAGYAERVNHRGRRGIRSREGRGGGGGAQ